jgi:hypothetical protein
MAPNANRYSGPMLTSIPYSPVFVPKMLWTPPNGMIANEATAVRIEISGATAYRKPTDVNGRDCSLVSSLRMSAIGCSIP